MDFAGFHPEDFLYFMDSDQLEKVRYIKEELHPRLRDFGHALAGGLTRAIGVSLRPQLRSGRWYKNPWATWVSLIYPDERQRSDNRRPRLSVFLDDTECIVGFQQNVWRPRWKRLVRTSRPALEKAMEQAASGRPKLDLILSYWTHHERQTMAHGSPAELLDAAEVWGQDFVVVGKAYPFPQKADLLTSPDLAEDALSVLRKAFPVYKLAFEQTEK